MSARDIVLVTEPIAAAAAEWLAERADMRHVEPGSSAFADLLGRAAGLVVRTYTKVNAELLEQAPRLRVVGRAGVGYDNVDVQAAHARGIEVVYSPGANTQAVVEFVVASVLDRIRPRPRVVSAMTSARWRRLRAESVGTRQLGDLEVGVLGMGRIGSEVARLVGSFGATVRYTDLVDVPAGRRHGAQPTSLGSLFARSDVVTVHVDGRSSNRHLVDAPLLARLPVHALLVNTSRGFVVDNAALAVHLRAHPEAAAAIDVHVPEPIDHENPLLGLPNARLTPHLAGATVAAHEQMSAVVRDVVAVLEGRRPAHPVVG